MKRSLTEHAQGHALGAVDVEVEPGRVGAGAVEQAVQALRAVAAGDDLIADPLQAAEAEVAAVFDDQLEAAGGAQAVDGRRAEGRDDGLRALLAAAVQQDRRRWRRRSGPGVRRWENSLQHDVHRAQVRGVGAGDQRLAGNAHRVVDPSACRWASRSMCAMIRWVRSTEAESGNCTLSTR